MLPGFSRAAFQAVHARRHTRPSTAASGPTWVGSCSAKRCTTTTRSRRRRTRSRPRPVPRLDQQIPLGAADGTRLHLAGNRRMELGVVGRLPSDHGRPARNMAREFRDPYVGLAPLRHTRRFAQQLVGRRAQLRRRDGTTTTTPIPPRPHTAWRGTRSTSPTCTSAPSRCSAWRRGFVLLLEFLRHGLQSRASPAW